MTRLNILASLVMDSYNQQYGKESDFFKIDDFAEFCGVFYYQVLQEEFEKQKRERMSLGALGPDDELVLNSDWYIDREVKIVDGKAKLENLFNFSGDTSQSSIQMVYADCCHFSKTTMMKAFAVDHTPKSDKSVYFYLTTEGALKFKRLPPKLDSVNVVYIPKLDAEADPDDVIVPSAKVAEIMTRTYNFMTSAKQGVVDKSNDQNPNKIIQTEIVNGKQQQ